MAKKAGEMEMEREGKADCSLSTHLPIWSSPLCMLTHANPEEHLDVLPRVDLSILMLGQVVAYNQRK